MKFMIFLFTLFALRSKWITKNLEFSLLNFCVCFKIPFGPILRLSKQITFKICADDVNLERNVQAWAQM